MVGSINKCKCSEKIINFDCNDEDKSKNCSTVSGEPKNYTKFNKKEFCVVRKGKTYKELIQANQIKNKSDPCPDNYISCGIIDTLDRKLCVKDGEECPITIKNISKIYSYNEYKENFELFINEKNEDNAPIISLIEVGDNFPCMNYSEKVWKTYDANDRNNVTSCSNIGRKEFDDRFIQIEGFKTNKADFYENNDLDAYITNELRSLNVNLYGRVLFCLYYNSEEINYERMMEIQENVDTYRKAIAIITGVTVIIFIAPIALVFFVWE